MLKTKFRRRAGKFVADYRVIPLSCEIFSDVKTTHRSIKNFEKHQPSLLYA